MLVVRVDANVRMGTGHVMRCLALAQAWQDAGRDVLFASTEMTPALQKRLKQENFRLEFLTATAGTHEDAEALNRLTQHVDWLIVDGYQFKEPYQVHLKQAGQNLLFVDDYGHCERYAADVILNQNLGAREDWYQNRAAETRLLLGPRFALLRREFQRHEPDDRLIVDRAKKILITLGGSDPDNVSLSVLNAFDRMALKGLSLKLIVGGSNPHFPTLVEAAEKSPHEVEVLQNVTDMGTQMMWADLAICAGGSSNWEMSYLGLPRVICVLAENQRQIAEELHEYGAAVRLRSIEMITTSGFTEQLSELIQTTESRRQLSEKSRELVDGRGARRVCELLQNWPGGIG